MEIKHLDVEDASKIWEINEQGLPGTGKVSKDEIVQLLAYSDYSLGAYDGDQLLGFVICLPPNTEYGSLNYAWFNQRYDDFLYVDRISVAKESQNQGIGSKLYQQVKKRSEEIGVPVTAEVNIYPPNPGSIRFHSRHDFEQVGVLEHDEKSVALFVYQQ